ncbi:MAG: histidine phosphatase family protein, partial [Candidatus Omnitrophota bacterium]
NRIQGNRNPDLSSNGLKQAGRLGRRLKRERISLIYTSDLKRSKRTAQIIQHILRVPLYVEKGLREINLGVWEGKTPKEIDQRHQQGYTRWKKAPSRYRIPKGEPVAVFRKRVLGTFKNLLATVPDGNLLVVSHGGVIATFLASLLKGDEDSFFLRLRLDNAGLSLVRLSDVRAGVVCYVNDTSHLK